MNVLNKILLNVSLPRTYINAYIKHIISEYKNEKNDDMKNNMKKSLSNFVLKLIDNKITSKENIAI